MSLTLCIVWEAVQRTVGSVLVDSTPCMSDMLPHCLNVQNDGKTSASIECRSSLLSPLTTEHHAYNMRVVTQAHAFVTLRVTRRV